MKDSFLACLCPSKPLIRTVGALMEVCFKLLYTLVNYFAAREGKVKDFIYTGAAKGGIRYHFAYVEWDKPPLPWQIVASQCFLL